MKPIKLHKNYIQIYKSDEWIKINFHAKNSHGCYIIKKLIFLENQSKFTILLSKTEYEIIENYKITFNDIMLSALKEYRNKLMEIKFRFSQETLRTIINEDYVSKYLKEIKSLETKIERLERKIKQ